MQSISLLPENLFHCDGVSPSIEVGRATGKLLVLTLGITHSLEHQSLDVSIWSSRDGKDWGLKALTCFPPKSYCGLYSILLNLASRRDTRYLRVEWRMKRLRKQPQNQVMCGFFVEAEESGARIPSQIPLDAQQPSTQRLVAGAMS